MRQMAQSFGFTAGGKCFDVSNQSLVSQRNSLEGNTFEGFEQVTMSLNNPMPYENNGNGQVGWSSNHNQQVCESMHITPSQRYVTLDQLEEKLLFNLDDNPWNISSGMCAKSHSGSPGHAPRHTNDSVTFLCGSWSALMQSTLAETSSGDAEMHEELNGLTFQNTVLPAYTQCATSVISSSVPQHSQLQMNVSGLAFGSQPVQTAMFSTVTRSTDSITQHYTDSGVLPISQPPVVSSLSKSSGFSLQSVNHWTSVPIQKISTDDKSEIVEGSDSSNKHVEAENVTSNGSSAKSVLKSKQHASLKALDAKYLPTSEAQESITNLNGCSVMHTSMNLMNGFYNNQSAAILPSNTAAVMTDQNAVSQPSKRKFPTSELFPWHKEVVNISVLSPDERMEEQEWAQATNQLIEAGNDTDLHKNGLSLNRPRKRLILTTRLMQKLLPLPRTSLPMIAALSYESAIYMFARFLLGDTCNMSSACNKASRLTDKIDKEESMTADRAVNKYFIKLRQLEDSLQRLKKRPSFVDTRVECLELERVSVINRFAKFHSRIRSNPSGLVSSSPQQMYLERYIAAQPMPKDVPDGLQCVLL